jgi:flagellar biosynthetic protein FliR
MVLTDTINLPNLAGAEVMGFVLVMARVGGLFVLAPGFSSKMIPAQAKLIIAAAISFALMPIATHGHPLPTAPGPLAFLIMKEVLVGIGFALPLAMLGGAIQAGATLLDTMIGFSFASQVDPITNTQNAVISQLYSLFTVMIFLLTGGDAYMIEGMAASYRIVPINHIPSLTGITGALVGQLDQVFVAGIEIVAPVVIALIISDAAFGLVSRAVPQMNVFFVGLPAKIMLGFLVIGATLPFVAAHLSDQLQASVQQALQTLGS